MHSTGGPGLVCAIEPRTTEDGILRPHVYWLAHGSSLVRCAPEHVRAEVPAERLARLDAMPETALSQPVCDRVRNALIPVQGPVRFLDLATGPTFSNAKAPLLSATSPPTMANEQLEPKEDDNMNGQQNTQTIEETTKTEQQAAAAQTAAAADTEPHTPVAAAADTQTAAAAETRTTATAEERNESRARSRSPIPRDERAASFENLRQSALKSYNDARTLDGLPAVGEDDRSFQNRFNEMNADESLVAEAFSEKKLTPAEKQLFEEARCKALQVWFDHDAWRPVNEDEARDGEVIPARFLQRWKPTKEGPQAYARVIIQGFKHKDVLNEELERESPTLSMLGRHSVYVMATHKRWKLWSADVKSAFMQADSIDATTRIYIRPSADMRRLLEKKIDLKPWQIMKACKPAFGDVRAPRQWNNTANEYLLHELNLIAHPLDRCVYLSLRQAADGDDPFCVFEYNGTHCIVDGILGLHVDDFIGAGEGVTTLNDITGEFEYDENTFAGRLQKLSRRFKFGSWDFGSSLGVKFCGADVVQSLNHETIQISLEQYCQKVKPICLDKPRKTMVNDACTDREHKQLRALLGALAWPAHQCVPQLCASVSILQSASSSPMIKDINEANKLLRFAKNVTKDYKMTFHAHGDISSLCIGAYTDAAWAVRPDGTSQGGLLVFLCNHEELSSEKPMPLTILQWQSKKLQRICRSSLSAEAQAAAAAVDELEWSKIFMACVVDPTLDIGSTEALRKFGTSPLATDARSLFDAARSITPGMKLSERRTAIEVAIVKDRMSALDGRWFWVNSQQQIADGLTKPAAKDNLAYVLNRGTHKLSFEPDFIAAKKVTYEEKEAERKEHEEASKNIFENQIFTLQEKDGNLCALPGCEKTCDASNPKNKFCSRRHFYLHAHRQGQRHDAWRTAAMSAVTCLIANEMPVVEGSPTENDEHIPESYLGTRFWLTVGVLVFFACIGLEHMTYKIYNLFLEKAMVLWKKNEVNEKEETVETNDRTRTLPQHREEVMEQILALSRRPGIDYRPGIDTGSSTCNSDSELEDEEYNRWKRLLKEVEDEPSSSAWRKLLRDLNDENSALDDQTRLILTTEGYTTQRWRKFRELLKTDRTQGFSDDQVRQWHRMWNDNICFLADCNQRIVRQRARIESLERINRLQFLNEKGEIKDKMVQTKLSFDGETTLPTRTATVLPDHACGAWEFRSDLNRS